MGITIKLLGDLFGKMAIFEHSSESWPPLFSIIEVLSLLAGDKKGGMPYVFGDFGDICF